MWIADQWKDYEVIDCSKGEKAGALGKLYPGAPGSAGHLGHAQEQPLLEEDERALPPQ